MSACIFVGPSSGGLNVPEGIRRLTPAALGSIYLAVEAGFQRIGLADGLFGDVPSVWHKEILFALSKGVEVVGASSMGALRAAELHGYGMQGVGVIYRLYRNCTLTDDDEVCLSHGIKEAGFAPLSVPMINVRFTARRLRRASLLSPTESAVIIRSAKQLHFTERNIDTALSLADGVIDKERRQVIKALFERFYVDQKHRDYRTLLAYLTRPPVAPLRNGPDWAQIVTWKWNPQFESSLGDIPPLHAW